MLTACQQLAGIRVRNTIPLLPRIRPEYRQLFFISTALLFYLVPAVIMVSNKRLEQLRLALKIQNYNTKFNIPCDYCFENNKKCFIIASNNRRLKCSKCVRKGRPCVNLS
jgi:hypothetical protein